MSQTDHSDMQMPPILTMDEIKQRTQNVLNQREEKNNNFLHLKRKAYEKSAVLLVNHLFKEVSLAVEKGEFYVYSDMLNSEINLDFTDLGYDQLEEFTLVARTILLEAIKKQFVGFKLTHFNIRHDKFICVLRWE